MKSVFRLAFGLVAFVASCNALKTLRQEELGQIAEDRSSDLLEEGLQFQIERLQTAVVQGDVESVDRITALLRDEASRRGSHNGSISKDNATSEHSTKPARIRSASTFNTIQPGSCILDDLFSLEPGTKYELAFELHQPKMVEAITWTKTGGWWLCAVHGENCACSGMVRMVDWERKVAAKKLFDARPKGDNMLCDYSNFDYEDVSPGGQKICECQHNGPGQLEADFHLHKRLTSKSYLQEIWIFLLRLLARTQLLPLGTGDRTYNGMANWAARHSPGSMPMVLERVWLEMFVRQVVQPSTTTLHRCLEWGDPARLGAGFNYLYMMPQCTDKMDMQFDAVFNKQKPMGMEGNVVYSDIDNLPGVLFSGAAGIDHRMDLIFATQVFEHIHNPKHAAKMLFASLKPGGCLVFTAPQQAQYHMVPHDFFRYTKEGALQVLQEAGFCVPAWAFAGGGDFVMDVARNAGLQVQDFPFEEVQGAFQIGYDKVSDAAITIHLLAFKPPNEQCASAMGPISNR